MIYIWLFFIFNIQMNAAWCIMYDVWPRQPEGSGQYLSCCSIAVLTEVSNVTRLLDGSYFIPWVFNHQQRASVDGWMVGTLRHSPYPLWIFTHSECSFLAVSWQENCVPLITLHTYVWNASNLAVGPFFSRKTITSHPAGIYTDIYGAGLIQTARQKHCWLIYDL